jgi:hypothetical protein
VELQGAQVHRVHQELEQGRQRQVQSVAVTTVPREVEGRLVEQDTGTELAGVHPEVVEASLVRMADALADAEKQQELQLAGVVVSAADKVALGALYIQVPSSVSCSAVLELLTQLAQCWYGLWVEREVLTTSVEEEAVLERLEAGHWRRLGALESVYVGLLLRAFVSKLASAFVFRDYGE